MRSRRVRQTPWSVLIGAFCLGVSTLGLDGRSQTFSSEPAFPESAAPSSSNLIPDLTPLNTNDLKPGKTPVGIVTSKTISPIHLTVPSLWWVREQVIDQSRFSTKLMEDWLAYPGQGSQPGRLDLIVNRQLWSLLDYLQRYEFINRFSSIARSYGYNIRVFDNQAELVGAYTCDFSGIGKQLQTVQPLPEVQATATIPPYSRNHIADRINCKMVIDVALKASQREVLKTK